CARVASTSSRVRLRATAVSHPTSEIPPIRASHPTRNLAYNQEAATSHVDCYLSAWCLGGDRPEGVMMVSLMVLAMFALLMAGLGTLETKPLPTTLSVPTTLSFPLRPGLAMRDKWRKNRCRPQRPRRPPTPTGWRS